VGELPTARNDYQLACFWDIMDEMYGERNEPKEKRVDKHGFIRQGMLEEYPILNQIANAIFSPTAKHVDLNGERVYLKQMANNTIKGLDYKGLRYVEQNPASGSPYALKAQAGEKIIWVIQGSYIGRIENGVVWKDPKHVSKPNNQPVAGRTTVIHIKDAPSGWKLDKRYVYIGRRNFSEELMKSKWHNPTPLVTREPQEREENLRQFTENFEISTLRQEVGELKGKVLVCYCKPQACHGDVLAAAANFG
jgi:hypothetical protein